MKEEEVDQYFKNKFGQFAPEPSADAWARLQSKMEPVQQKRPTMWVYYAAASVSLILLSGALLFWFRTNSSLPVNGDLANLKPATTQPTPLIMKEPILADINTQAPALPETVEPVTQEKVKETTNNASTSTTTSKPIKKGKKIRPGILVATHHLKNQEKTYSKDDWKTVPENSPVTTVVAQNVPNLPTVAEERIMEVIIKKAPEAEVAYTDNSNAKEYSHTQEIIKENISKKGRLVKNIFKQARNLKNGEKVELSALGLNANYRIDVESKLLKQKYSKVINL
ncbi:hypothetical protein [Adhaeribacter radiodurans]|uniref:Uncharacterized protein n=1 Tax=Adhaeribacter radiodurans TaxID=2745197 RepID=A0A7L7L7C8_9BACT|nr:hypothetical protein [Adhaeribacter radiodurans]QMU28710.1 hypothetical protein HUW48_11980 [Adhaeribacter radiodurans]